MVEPYYAGTKVYAITTHLRHFVHFVVLLWHELWLPCTEKIYYRRPYAIKNQRKARNTPQRRYFVPKPLVGGFGCIELVVYGIRELDHCSPPLCLVIRRRLNGFHTKYNTNQGRSVYKTVYKFIIINSKVIVIGI